MLVHHQMAGALADSFKFSIGSGLQPLSLHQSWKDRPSFVWSWQEDYLCSDRVPLTAAYVSVNAEAHMIRHVSLPQVYYRLQSFLYHS